MVAIAQLTTSTELVLVIITLLSVVNYSSNNSTTTSTSVQVGATELRLDRAEISSNNNNVVIHIEIFSGFTKWNSLTAKN